jgi:surface protein
MSKVGKAIKKGVKSVGKVVTTVAKVVANVAKTVVSAVVEVAKVVVKATVAVIATTLLMDAFVKRPSNQNLDLTDNGYGGDAGGYGGNGAGPAAVDDPGARIQLPPMTTNKIPIVYGEAIVKGTMIDAKISVDNKFMWYVLALSEVPDVANGSISLDNNFGVRWNDTIAFKPTNNSSVTQFTDYKTLNSSNTPTVDTSINGNLNIWLYSKGSFTPIVNYPDYGSAVAVLSDASTGGGIRLDNTRWTNDYTMDNLAFMVVRVKYNQDISLTGLGDMDIWVKNSITNPADVLLDYMTNTRYGWGLSTSLINLDSLSELRDYSNQTITYTESLNGVSTTKTIPRYRINGAFDTNVGCLANVMAVLDACDSWLSWDEVNGKWKVTVNRSWEEQHGANINDLFAIFSETIEENTGSKVKPPNYAYVVSEMDVSLGDRNRLYNEYEVEYMWQGPSSGTTGETMMTQGPGLARKLSLSDKLPINQQTPNEPSKELRLNFPFTTNPASAKFLANRRLAQTRDQLAVEVSVDYAGIQLQAGDVIRVYSKIYGWDVSSSMPNGKLFRVMQVIEEKKGEGEILSVTLSLAEYSENVYTIANLDSFVPSTNTGMVNPRLISKPLTPIVTNISPRLVIPKLDLTFVIPPDGNTVGMEVWYYEDLPGLTTAQLDNVEFLLYDLQLPKITALYPRDSQHEVSLTGLPKNKGDFVYYIRLRAISTQSKSEFSDAVSFKWEPQGSSWVDQYTIPAFNNVQLYPPVLTTTNYNPAATNINIVPIAEFDLPAISEDSASESSSLYDISLRNHNHQLNIERLNLVDGPIYVHTGWFLKTTDNGVVTEKPVSDLNLIGVVFDTESRMELQYDLSKGDANSRLITLPIKSVFGSITIDWGDNIIENRTAAGNYTHTYATTGIKTVKVYGGLTGYGVLGLSQPKLVGVSRFNFNTTNFAHAFANCANLSFVPTTLPSNVTDTSYMFDRAAVFNQNISGWDTSSVTNMEGMFFDARMFNQPLNTWNVSNVTSMQAMFAGANALVTMQFNQPLNNWITNSVVNMASMFRFAGSFDQNIGTWNTANVVNMSFMFQGGNISQFNNGGSNSISTWNTGNVTNMEGMFDRVTQFNQPIGSWNTGNVTNMRSMFSMANNGAFNQNIGSWNVSKVTTMSQMFRFNAAFNNGGSSTINNWVTTDLVDVTYMFQSAAAFNQPIGNWNMVKVTSLEYMFSGAFAFNQNINAWNVSNVVNLRGLFDLSNVYNQPMNLWNTSKVTIMERTFGFCGVFNQNISSWNVSLVTNMNEMFRSATSFNQNLSPWVTGLLAQPINFSAGGNTTFANNANNLKPFLAGGVTRINT